MQILARMLSCVGVRDLLTKALDRCVLPMRRQKRFQIRDLAFESIVYQVVEMGTQDKPHAGAEHDLRTGKDDQVPQRQPHANGELLHACPSGRIMYPTPRTV